MELNITRVVAAAHNNIFPDTPSPTEAPPALADPEGGPA